MNKMPTQAAFDAESAPSEASGTSGASGLLAGSRAGAMRAGGAMADPFANLERAWVLMPDGTWAQNPEPLALTPLQCLEDNPNTPALELQGYRDVEQERLETLHGPEFSLDPPQDLSNWGRVLADLGVDEEAARSLGFLANIDPMAHAEATRILAHMLKPGTSFRQGPSRWLASAVARSQEFLEHWDTWEAPRAPPTTRPAGATTDRPWARWAPRAPVDEEVIWEAQEPQAAAPLET